MAQRDISFWNGVSGLDTAPALLSEIVSAAADVSLLVAANDRVISVQGGREGELGHRLSHAEGQPITAYLAEDSRAKMTSALKQLREDGQFDRAVEVNHTDTSGPHIPVRYRLLKIDPDGTALLLGRDLSAISETQAQLVETQMSLEQGYEARREFDARYRLLLRTVRDAIVFMSVSDGRIRDLNEPAASILGSTRSELLDTVFAETFEDRSKEEFAEAVMGAAMSEKAAGLKLRARRVRTPVRVEPQVFRAAGERVVIARLMREDDVGAQRDGLAIDLSALFDKSSDALVFASTGGTIMHCNDAFLDMIDAAHMSDVAGTSLSQFLGRGQVDLNVLAENAKRHGQMRLYSSKIVNDLGASTAVEMSCTYLNDRAEPELGFVIRDASRSEAARRPSLQPTEESSRNVMELVGSATLKEIVAETTDVVEKMCIETAVSLTRNNRVAAAEMLGLSRQSLYVKLRKYGLLSRETDN
ncbi:transcriptional regulator PpsR [Litorisediminicola beolgyonensis]|uniref:Transcriptional regulator PpsR n=1 Tax=Litorisediminicola beolgyonensis TaxID=1173614 RepID=A0ABW3ZHJ2_9RHOB